MAAYMKQPDWQLKSPIDAIVFDCDGTLSHLEGINELAKLNGVGSEVERLTAKAMDETGITSNLYRQRISYVKPSRQQLINLGQDYFYSRSLDITSVISIFKFLKKSIYILSAGINPAVKIFGELLDISVENIYAVDVEFDTQGNFIDYDYHSPLTDTHGKRKIIQQIQQQHKRILHVGDGMNDFESHDVVDRFVGYGGAYYRESIANLCQFYIKSASMLPLIPLSITQLEYEKLSQMDRENYYEGLEYINDDGVIVHSV